MGIWRGMLLIWLKLMSLRASSARSLITTELSLRVTITESLCHSECGRGMRWSVPVAYPEILFGGEGGVQQIQLRTEDREKGDLGAVAL